MRLEVQLPCGRGGGWSYLLARGGGGCTCWERVTSWTGKGCDERLRKMDLMEGGGGILADRGGLLRGNLADGRNLVGRRVPSGVEGYPT